MQESGFNNRDIRGNEVYVKRDSRQIRKREIFKDIAKMEEFVTVQKIAERPKF